MNVSGVGGISQVQTTSLKPRTSVAKHEESSARPAVSQEMGVVLTKGASLAKQSPDVDMGKVERLKAKIDSGQFKPDSGKIAASMLSESKAFLSASKK